MTDAFDPETADTGQDEYARPADELSIDDALEADRDAAEGADPVTTDDAYGFDADRERAAEDTAAAEQGNRDEDRMEVDADDEELDRIAGPGGDSEGTERDLTDPED